MDSKGVFIALEGVDGSGKSTQLQLLADKLQKHGHAVAVFDFPLYDQPSSIFVRKYLEGAYGSAEKVGPYSASLFYALDHYHAAAAMRQALREGKVVIANRYTGSSMANQGTHFANAEQRRGFFIWLDYLAYQTMGLPRPDKNFILRLPPETSQTLLSHKARKGYTGKEPSEADLQHQQKTAEVYDDLAQLFPKDFMRLDCVRGNKLLRVDQVHDMLWQIIQPLLPAVPDNPNLTETTDKPMPTPETATQTAAKPIKNGSTIKIQGMSNLIAARVSGANVACIDPAPGTELSYFVPKNLDDMTAAKYRAVMDSILETHANLVEKLTDYLDIQTRKPGEAPQPAVHQTRATAIAKAVLPLASRIAISIPAGKQAVLDVVGKLQRADSAEATMAAKHIMTEAHAILPELATSNPNHTQDDQAITSLAEQYLPETYSLQHSPATLLNVAPRNELDLVPHILYSHSNLSLQEIKDQVGTWGVDRKLEVLQAITEGSASVLKQVHYTWDLLCGFEVFRVMQDTLQENLTAQTPSPRYGYEVPEIIESADLTDLWEKCFDLSAKLHSTLQSEGYEQEAAYAVLMGHRVRWELALNAQQLALLNPSQPDHPGYTKLVQHMHQQLTEVHPILSGKMSS